MKKKNKAYSIVFRLRMLFLMPFAAFFLIVIGILGFQYRALVRDDIIRQLEYEDKILAQSLEARISNAQSSVNAIIINLNQIIPDSKLKEFRGPVIDADMRRLIYSSIVNTFTTFYNADQVIVVWNNGVTWYGNWMENYSMQDGEEELLAEMEIQEVDNTGKWLRKISASQIAGEGYYFAKRYVDINTGKQLGYVILKEKDIFQSISNKNSERKIYLFDPDGKLMNSSDQQALNERNSCISHDKEVEYALQLKQELENVTSDSHQVMNSIRFARGWLLISVTDMRAAQTELNDSIAWVLLAALLASVLTYAAVCKIIGQIIGPIQTLSDHMMISPEQFPVPVKLSVKNDEIGVLVTCFNEMADRNQKLIEMLLEEKKQQEQLKLSLLQSQIKPHFLYNTLDTIYCLILMDRNEEGGRMTKLLSDYYRHVLSHGMDWVLLFEEVQQTENYLQIQSIRYRDILDFEIRVDDNVENIKIPKLTLQPLVENAIYHGIKPLGRRGHLRLEISQKAQVLSIRVIDDGVGLSSEKFQEVIERGYKSAEGFGLGNVIDRLNLYYEKQCHISLEKCRVGTQLLIEILIQPEVL